MRCKSEKKVMGLFSLYLICIILFLALSGCDVLYASFRLDDFSYLNYSQSVKSVFSHWSQSDFKPGGLNWRPFSMMIFWLLDMAGFSERGYAAFISLNLATGVVVLFESIRLLLITSRDYPLNLRAFATSALLITLVAGLSSGLNANISFIAAGVHDGLLFLAAALILYVSIRRELSEDTHSDRILRIKYNTILFLLLFGAYTLKENGLVCISIPFFVSLFCMDRQNLETRSYTRTFLNRSFISFKRNGYLLFSLVLYFFWRFEMIQHRIVAVNHVPFLKQLLFVTTNIPQSLAWRWGYDSGAGIYFLPVVGGFPIALSLLRDSTSSRTTIIFLSFALCTLVPFLLSTTYGPNQWALFLVPFLGIVFLGTYNFLSLTFSSNSSKSRRILSLLCLGFYFAFLGSFQLQAAQQHYRDIYKVQVEESQLNHLLKGYQRAIARSFRKGDTIVMQGFPAYKDHPSYLRSVFRKQYGIILDEYRPTPGGIEVTLKLDNANIEMLRNNVRLRPVTSAYTNN